MRDAPGAIGLTLAAQPVGASVFFDVPDSPDVGVVLEVEDDEPSLDPLDD